MAAFKRISYFFCLYCQQLLHIFLVIFLSFSPSDYNSLHGQNDFFLQREIKTIFSSFLLSGKWVYDVLLELHKKELKMQLLGECCEKKCQQTRFCNELNAFSI